MPCFLWMKRTSSWKGEASPSSRETSLYPVCRSIQMIHTIISLIADNNIVFLRLLEYFDGIMFLTTNRSHTIDLAFQSRIDLTIPYESLPESSRAAVWRNFIKGLESAGEMNVEELASHPFNGRQIKNVVKLARMLATKRSESLHMDHLRQIIQLSLKGQTFEDN